MKRERFNLTSIRNKYTNIFLAISIGLWVNSSVVLFAKDIPTPAAPSNVTIEYEKDTSVKIGWTDNSNNEQHFKIYRRYLGYAGNPDTYDFLIQVDGDTEAAIITGLDPVRSYLFAVSAYNINADPSQSEKARSPLAKTTHTWDGALKVCVDEVLDNSSSDIPTRTELESLISFSCVQKV